MREHVQAEDNFSMASEDPRLGVTASLSQDPPSPQDLKLDEALLRELKSRNEFEAVEETQRR